MLSLLIYQIVLAKHRPNQPTHSDISAAQRAPLD